MAADLNEWQFILVAERVKEMTGAIDREALRAWLDKQHEVHWGSWTSTGLAYAFIEGRD